MTTALVASQFVFAGRDTELHVAPEGLSLTRRGKVGPDSAYQLAELDEVATVELQNAGRPGIKITFRTDRPPWTVTGLPQAQALWAVEMLRGGVAVAQRANVAPFAEAIPLSGLPAAAQGILGGGEDRVAELLDLMIAQAIHHKASDIHFEALRNALRVSFRLDGLLVPVLEVPLRLQQRLSARLKVISGAAVYRRDIPQEGRCVTEIGGRTVDLRVSIIPTIHGEKATVRVFDPDVSVRSLEDLGLTVRQHEQLARLLGQPQGSILLTGPSGSGKTTTLYACLRHTLAAGASRPSVATVEDPVEYDLGEANQTQVNPAVGLTFATGLRTVLRQDPQVIMVGEVRDLETAEVAIQAGLTGHLILSTVHAPSAAGVFVRLTDLGVEPYLVASSVTATMAQRLVRVLCPACATDATVDADQARTAGLDPQALGPMVKQARGCDQCRQTGYRGRTGIFEIIEMDEPLRELILGRKTAGELQRCAEGRGAPSLREAAGQKVAAGLTTVEEVARVLGTPQV